MKRTFFLFSVVLLCNFLSGQGNADESHLSRQLREAPEEVILDQQVITVPMLGTPTVPMVAVYLNDQGPFVFQVNTGSDFMLIRRELADKLDLPVEGRLRESRICHVKELRIGQAHFRGLLTGVQEWPEGVDGILGFNTFMKCVFTINFPGRNYSFSMKELDKPDGFEILKYRYGQVLSPYLSILMEKNAVPFRIDTGLPVYLQVDAGDEGYFNFKFPPMKNLSMGYYDESSGVRIGRTTDHVYLGRHLVLEPLVAILPGEENAIGSGILQHFVLIFDPFNKTLGIQRNSEVPIIVPSLRQLGFKPEMREGAWYVAEVYPWMQELGLGILPGDRILVAEDIPAAGLGKDDWSFFEKNLNYLALILDRKGEEIQLEVPLRIILP